MGNFFIITKSFLLSWIATGSTTKEPLFVNPRQDHNPLSPHHNSINYIRSKRGVVSAVEAGKQQRILSWDLRVWMSLSGTLKMYMTHHALNRNNNHVPDDRPFAVHFWWCFTPGAPEKRHVAAIKGTHFIGHGGIRHNNGTTKIEFQIGLSVELKNKFWFYFVRTRRTSPR